MTWTCLRKSLKVIFPSLRRSSISKGALAQHTLQPRGLLHDLDLLEEVVEGHLPFFEALFHFLGILLAHPGVRVLLSGELTNQPFSQLVQLQHRRRAPPQATCGAEERCGRWRGGAQSAGRGARGRCARRAARSPC